MKIGDTIKVDGKTYATELSVGFSCDGCAFVTVDGCQQVYPCVTRDSDFAHWKEVPE